MGEFVLENIHDLGAWKEYVDGLYGKVNYEADRVIYEKMMKCKTPLERKKSDKGLAALKAYIVAPDVSLRSPEGVVIPVSIVSNPGMKIKGEKAVFYLRVASIGSHFGRTFIVRGEVPLNELEGRVSVNADVLVPSIMPYECVEDPRVDPEFQKELYHVRALYRGIPRALKSSMEYGTIVVTFRGREEKGRLESLEAVHFENEDGTFLLRDYRDTFPLNRDYMVVRPFVKDKEIGSVFIGPREGAKVAFNELEPVPELMPNWRDETKSGGNVAVRISPNESLLLYHVVDHHGIYYTYGALFDNGGGLLGHTEVPILAPSLKEYYGRRASTIFVCGAALHKDSLLLSAGRDDEITAIYEIGVEELMEHMKYLRG